MSCEVPYAKADLHRVVGWKWRYARQDPRAARERNEEDETGRRVVRRREKNGRSANF
jgi:hypothetical protein